MVLVVVNVEVNSFYCEVYSFIFFRLRCIGMNILRKMRRRISEVFYVVVWLVGFGFWISW